MKTNKIFIISIVLLVLVASMTVISAETSFTSTSTSKTLNNNELTMNNVKFLVPNGFEEVETDTDKTKTESDSEKDTTDIDGTVVDSKISSEFKNSAGDKIEMTVGIKANNQKIQSISPANAEQKTIKNKQGYLIKTTDDGKNKVKFEYLDDGKLVKIEAPNEEMISQIIP